MSWPYVWDRDSTYPRTGSSLVLDVSQPASGIGGVQKPDNELENDPTVQSPSSSRSPKVTHMPKAKARGATKMRVIEVIEILSDDEQLPEVKGPISGKYGIGDEAAQPKQPSQAASPLSLVASSSTTSIIDLTVTSLEGSSDEATRGKAKLSSKRISREVDTERGISAAPLYAGDSSDESDISQAYDDSTLILNEPRSARKPIRNTKLFVPASGSKRRPLSSHNVRAHEDPLGADSEPDMHANSLVAKRTPASTPGKAGKVPRMTKKASEAAEFARRENYARVLFGDLNRSVFEEGIPAETQLKWSKRLLTTAGRAKWHKSKNGVQTSEIELAVKILDCDERIRNTLSHEMCHLACWIINGQPQEGHGPIFRGWAKKVMRARPDIEVTTRHDYEIVYKYEWQCEGCNKIYGRHSKSIRPDECVCGVCKVGKLIPLFEQKAPKTPKSKVGSQMAAGKGRDSPIAALSPTTVGTAAINHDTPVRSWKRMPGAFPDSIVVTDSSDDETSRVDVLADILGAAKI